MAKGPNGPVTHANFDSDPEYFTQFQERFDREQFYGLGYGGPMRGQASVFDDFPPKAHVIEMDEPQPVIFRHVEDRDKREKD